MLIDKSSIVTIVIDLRMRIIKHHVPQFEGINIDIQQVHGHEVTEILRGNSLINHGLV